jgi:DNA polymerase-1
VPVCNDDGEHIGGITGFLKSIAFVIRSIQPTRIVIVFDGKGGSVRRRDLYADYKAGRKINTKFNRPDHLEIDVDQEVKNMRNQLIRLVEYLENLPVTILSIDNVEADDVIAYMTTNIFNNSQRVTIMSDDKDFLQLVNSNVSVWRPVVKTAYTEEVVLEKLGVPAYNYLLLKLFLGDPSDNIKGVSGVGLKTLLKYVPEIRDTHITLDDVLQICNDRLTATSASFYQTVLDNESVLRLNYQLMQLSDADIPGNVKSIVRSIINEQPIPTTNRFQFKRLLMEDKAYTAFKDPDGWLLSSFNQLSGFATMKNENKNT